ncbi:MAG: hypothetical protein AABZ11_01385 [Nitrospinota bacterium]|mgnify:FL=1
MSRREYIILPLLFLISFFYLIVFCKYGFNVADEGVPLSGALRIMKGEVPLKDFQGYMPGVYYFYYTILKIFGMDILTVRYVISFFTSAMTVMFYLSSRKIMSVSFSLFGAFVMVIVPGPYYVRFLNFFIIANILVFNSYIHEKSRAAFYMGLVGGLTLLFRQDLGLIVFFIAITTFFLKRYLDKYTKIFIEIKRYVSGYFLILLLPAIYYIFENKLLFFLKYNYNAFFGGYQKMSLPYPNSASRWYEIGLFYVPVIVYLLAFFHVIAHLKQKNGYNKENIYKLYIVLIGVLSFNQALWRTHPENIVKVIIPAMILYFYLFELFYSWSKDKTKDNFKLIVRVIVLIIFSFIPLSYGYAMNKNYGAYIGSMSFPIREYKLIDSQRARIYATPKVVSEYYHMITYIDRNTGPSDKIFIVPFIGIPLYFLSDRINSTYFEWIMPADVKIYPRIEEKIIESLTKDNTKTIIYVDFALDGLESRRFKNYAPKLCQWIMDNYYLDEIIGDYQILKYNGVKNPFFDNYDYSLKETPDYGYIKKTVMNINGDKRETLFEHPPSVIKYKISIPADSLLNFGIAIDPQVWETGRGDGVSFEISISEGEKEKILFSRYIDPKTNKNERRWIDNSIDLSDYGGREVILSLRTSAGPKDDNSYEWAGWSKLEFVTKKEKL